MTELSPAAQSVWDAFNQDEAGVFVDYGDKLAAALRAAADQVVPEGGVFLSTAGAARIRRDLLAIAAELLQRQALVPVADTHYEWELEDAQSEWQAGGSSNSQSDVESEGMRYLQTYAQDGPHKLIIRQHTTQTINEITNG